MSETCAECIHPRMDHEHYGCELCDCDRPYGRRPNHTNRDREDIEASIAGDTPWDREHAQDHSNGDRDA